MRHLGDITKISGYSVPIVDCIIGGSPCQDLSVAGKRAGLDGERSGLYIEQVRIVKEMRKRDERNGRSGVDVRPRYMVWENVPGAFSSNKGEDFRIVLEEIAKVCDKDAVIPMPDKGKWTNHGCIVGDGWSVAWRVLDAQFWGVPQRRRRIALVADFGGQSAPEILFVRQSVSGHTDESKPKRKGASTDAQGGIGADDCYTFEPGVASQEGGHIYENVSGTLRANAGDNQMATAYGISSYNSNAMKSDNPHSGIYEADTSRTLDANGGNPSCNQGGIAIVESVPYTLKIRSGCEGGDNVPTVLMEAYQHHGWRESDTCGTHTTRQNNTVRGDTPLVCYSFHLLQDPISSEGKSPCFGGGNSLNGQASVGVVYRQGSYADYVEGECGTLKAAGGDLGGGSENLIVSKPNYTVRRLTPLECERLQGYPDGWTDIGEWVDSNGKTRRTSDAARYKALGNSIALPPWKWVLKRLCACYERDATMASLFDGIGGFPYLWEQLNGKGSCLWASEIEEFPMAVTKVRIGE